MFWFILQAGSNDSTIWTIKYRTIKDYNILQLLEPLLTNCRHVTSSNWNMTIKGLDIAAIGTALSFEFLFGVLDMSVNMTHIFGYYYYRRHSYIVFLIPLYTVSKLFEEKT